METTISVRLRADALKDLAKVEKKWQTDRSEAIRRLLASALKEWKLQNTLENLAQHKISIGKAAEECDISLWEMIDKASEKKIDWVGYSDKDLEKDLALLK